MQEQQLNPVQEEFIEKMVLMESLVKTDMGVSFLQWLCQLTGWSRPTMNTEESARRDLWIHLRKHIPADLLPLIENEDIRREQKLIKEALQTDMTEQPSDEPTL